MDWYGFQFDQISGRQVVAGMVALSVLRYAHALHGALAIGFNLQPAPEELAMMGAVRFRGSCLVYVFIYIYNLYICTTIKT